MYFLRCCCFLFRFLFCFCCSYILAVCLFNGYLLWYDHVASLEPYLSWWKDTYCISSKKHLEVFLVTFLSCISSKALCSLVIEIAVSYCVKMFDLCFNFLLFLNKKKKKTRYDTQFRTVFVRSISHFIKCFVQWFYVCFTRNHVLIMSTFMTAFLKLLQIILLLYFLVFLFGNNLTPLNFAKPAWVNLRNFWTSHMVLLVFIARSCLFQGSSKDVYNIYGFVRRCLK